MQHRFAQTPPVESCSGNRVVQLALENAIDIGRQNTSPLDIFPERLLAHVRLGSVQIGRFVDRLFEGQMLKGVQRVVMNEDADGSLRRQQMRGMLEFVSQLFAPV